MPNELSEKVYSDGTVVKLRDDAAREQLAPQVITNLVVDTTKMSITGYDCIVKAGICFLALYGCTFTSSGTVANGITNIPKAAKIQVCSCGYGSSANAVAVMPEYAWIVGLQNTVNFITTETNKSKARDYNFAYPVYS